MLLGQVKSDTPRLRQPIVGCWLIGSHSHERYSPLVYIVHRMYVVLLDIMDGMNIGIGSRSSAQTLHEGIWLWVHHQDDTD